MFGKEGNDNRYERWLQEARESNYAVHKDAGCYMFTGSQYCLNFQKKPCWFHRAMMNPLLGLKWEEAK